MADFQLFWTSWKDGWSATVTSGATMVLGAGSWESLTVSWTDAPQTIYGVKGFYAYDPAAPSELFKVYHTVGSPTNTWTVVRGAENTTPVAHSTPFTLLPIVPAAYMQMLDDNRQRVRVVPENIYISNTTSFTQVTPLEIPVEAGATYEIVYHLAIKSDPGADIKTIWDVPSGTTGTKFVSGPTSDSAGFTNQGRHEARMSGHAITTAIPYQTYTSVNDSYVMERSLVTLPGTPGSGGAGSIWLKFAQNTATVANTGIGVGSYVTVRKVEPILDPGL